MTATEWSINNVNKGEFISSIFISFVATCFVWETLLEDYSKYVDKD
ncbi:hypothetical protein PBI_SCTP2_379 [Salicola phage SCTP-2]|nr:hypothetical protein PBI_SCTP2_379 [Salicola phage SCTP-2]